MNVIKRFVLFMYLVRFTIIDTKLNNNNFKKLLFILNNLFIRETTCTHFDLIFCINVTFCTEKF